MHIIQTDDFDNLAWRIALQDCRELAQCHARMGERFPGHEHVLEDLFHLLHAPAPIWNRPGDLTLHEYILREFAATQEFKELRLLAEGNAANATMAAAILGDKLEKRLEDKVLDRLEVECRAMGAYAEARHHHQALQGLVTDDPSLLANPDWALAMDQAAEALQSAEATVATLVPVTGFDDEVSDLRRAARKDMVEARIEVRKLDEILATFGGWEHPTLEQKLRLAERVKNRPQLQKLVELAGRMRRIALTKKASVVREVKAEIVGVTMVKDPTKALPSELVLLKNPVTRPLFFKKMVEGELLGYEQSHREPLGGGPIVLCIDGSGSMEGDGELWAKAVLNGYLAIAEKEKRDMVVCQFGDVGQLVEFSFTYKSNPRAINQDLTLRAMEYFMNAGGTCLETPLRWAASQIQPETRFGDADVVMLTDGASHFSDAFLKDWKGKKASLGFRSYGVLIGAPGGLATLKLAIDEVIFVQDVMGAGDEVTDVLFRR